ncbi:MAG TPA: TolC family protein [Bacteroidales bacterium]
MLKKKLINIILIFVGLLAANNSIAQEVYNLQMLIDRVLEENYQILIQRNLQLITENNNTLGNAGFLPVVDAEGNATVSYNNTKQEYASGSTNQGTNAKSSNLNGLIAVNWTVFDGFKMFAKRKQLDLIQQLGAVNTRYFIEQTVADVTLAYYEVILQKELLKNYRNTLEISRFRYQLEKKKITVGSGNALLYNQALVDYNNDSLTVLETEMVIKTLEIRITRFANLDPDNPLSLAEVDISPGIIGNKDSLVARAIAANPEIKQSMLEEMIAGQNVQIEKADYYPVVNVFGQYSGTNQNNEVGFMLQNKSYGPMFGVSVRFNLYNGGNDRREVINQEIVEDNTVLNNENTVSLIKAAVIEKHYHYNALMQQFQLAKENALAAQRSLDIATLQFQNGTINGYDFRQTQLTLIIANNKAKQIGFRIKAAEIELNRLTGDLLDTYLQ